MYCPDCGLRQPDEHRFCLSCGRHLPRELLAAPSGPKMSRWFLTIPVGPDDPPGAMLRVTRYLEEAEFITSEGTVRIPHHHVRLSIWHHDHPVCVVSIPEDEGNQLREFLSLPLGSTVRSR